MQTEFKINQREQGVCPVCNGEKQIKMSERERMNSWSKSEYKQCDNCGGQTMTGIATGKVFLNKEGNPCVHKYVGRNAGRCYTIYTCTECGMSFGIDSGD